MRLRLRPARPAPEASPAQPPRPFFAPPPRLPFVRPSGTLAAGGFGGQWQPRGQAFAAGGFGGAGQPTTAPTHPTHPSAVDAATRDEFARNLAILIINRIFVTESARIGRGKVSLNSYLSMATMQGITGKLSGKMGSAVFRVRSGQQIVAQYNPIVKNPNTEGQQSTRASFKLMSQLATIMAPAMGSFIIKSRPEGGKPTKRNAFFSHNYGLVTTTDTAQGVVASIPMEQLKLTSSFRALGSISTDPATGSFDMDIDGIPEEVKTVRVILIDYKSDGALKQAAIASILDLPVASSQLTHSFEGLAAGDYTVLAYGLIPTEAAAGKISLDSIHTPADDDFVSAVELDKLVSDGVIVETMTIGANVAISA